MATALQHPPQERPQIAAMGGGSLTEKRISRVTLRLSDTLRSRLEFSAHQLGSSMSNVIVHTLNDSLEASQEVDGRTWSDTIRAARRALDLLEGDFDGLTHLQRMWVLRRIHNVQGLLIGGNHEQA